ncbi:hypothetical protein GCM10027162_50180 [Streptomyces incanus]
MKKPGRSTGFVRRNRRQKYAAVSPMTMPPNTPGFQHSKTVTVPSVSRQPAADVRNRLGTLRAVLRELTRHRAVDEKPDHRRRDSAHSSVPSPRGFGDGPPCGVDQFETVPLS